MATPERSDAIKLSSGLLPSRIVRFRYHCRRPRGKSVVLGKRLTRERQTLEKHKETIRRQLDEAIELRGRLRLLPEQADRVRSLSDEVFWLRLALEGSEAHNGPMKAKLASFSPTRRCYRRACSTRRRLRRAVSPDASLPPARRARPSPCGGLPSSPRRPRSTCSGSCRAATSGNSPGHGNPPPPNVAPRSEPPPRPPAPVPAHTGIASRAAHMCGLPRRTTRSHRRPQPASGPHQFPRRESTCARR